nr:MAG TPA: hypothetical protein [Crassvirales sp.]DAO83150.1 MAG TPA: hypothetical protein [Bacteriophage sp.]DAQ87782.1 MAG TPA: hypothetical protein [Caudoviricetes sp.]DAV54027.1 MAG TPA: hypothetical protein [Caudoviricetes sp.]
MSHLFPRIYRLYNLLTLLLCKSYKQKYLLDYLHSLII